MALEQKRSIRKPSCLNRIGGLLFKKKHFKFMFVNSIIHVKIVVGLPIHLCLLVPWLGQGKITTFEFST